MLATQVLTACARGGPAPSAAPTSSGATTISGPAALATLRAWLARPRGLGDARRGATITALGEELEARGADRVERIPHTAQDPGGTGAYALVEIVGHFRERAPRRFILATHFDTRPWADEEADPRQHANPVPGANDGTSGLAVVLELIAPLAARLPADVGFSVVLFDGEELGRPNLGGYCMGSRYLAEQIVQGQQPTLARAAFGIVLDMVGDADLHVPVEPSSRGFHPALVEHVWGTAAALGIDAFDPQDRGVGIVDDHRFLSQAGVPSILVIDRDYAAWHHTDDDIDHVSADSLARVGTVVLESIVRWYER